MNRVITLKPNIASWIFMAMAFVLAVQGVIDGLPMHGSNRAYPISYYMGNCQQSRLLHHICNDCSYSLSKSGKMELLGPIGFYSVWQHVTSTISNLTEKWSKGGI